MTVGIQQDVTIGDCRLILGDCLDVLPNLKGVADLLFCDVAYELTSGGNAHQSMGGIFARDQYSNDGRVVAAVEVSGGDARRHLTADVRDAGKAANMPSDGGCAP